MALASTDLRSGGFARDADGRLLTVASPVSGSGVYKTVQGTDPAANTEFSVTVTAGKYWALYAVSVNLVQGATQTPQPTLIIDDGTNVLFQGFGASSAQNASVTTQYTWEIGRAHV